MCRLITNEKHCDNCDKILAPHLLHCKSLGSCSIFARFARFHGSNATELAAKLAEKERDEAQSQAVALLCHHIEDGIRKVSPEDAAVLKAAGWIVVDTKVWEEVVDRARRLGLLVEGDESEENGARGGG